MSAGSKIGGIVALIVGVLLLFLTILYPGIPDIINWMINLIIIIVVLLGSGLVLGNKKGGGKLILLAGSLSIVFSILATIDTAIFSIIAPYSFLSTYFSVYIPYITVEGILLLFAGIIVVASSE